MSITRDRQVHMLEPVVDKHCKILILGSFPSVKSREEKFYYAHPSNRFWKVLSTLLECKVPTSIEEKKELLLNNHIALWDSVQSCTIINSDDNSIKEVIANDIVGLIKNTQITKIFCNGKAAYHYYHLYQEEYTKIKAVVLPSTSPANARFTIDKLLSSWKVIIK